VKSIYKYPLEATETQVLTLQGKVLSVGVQNDNIMIWAVHDDDAPERSVKIRVLGTGHSFVGVLESDFVGTVFIGRLVFHVFATPIFATGALS
jgi:hypothetical protein